MIRHDDAVVAALAVLALMAECHGGDDWNPEAPFAPSLRPAFGARVTDGQLRIWTGSPCVGVTRLALVFEPDRVELVLKQRRRSARRGLPSSHRFRYLSTPFDSARH